ncbi:MAG: hypothetical protein KAT71_01230 [Gammaproteobacteria bacterium]|nr:hypothetical protein [Gammaproteobacteria bacterium]
MAISTPVVFVRRFSLLYYLVKTLFSFMVVVVVGVIPILVIYLQKDYLWLHYYGLIMLLFLVFYAIKKFSCIDHDKFAELIIKPKIIKDKDASFLFHKAFWRDAQVIEEMFKPLFKNKLLNKVFYYCLVKYLSVYIIFVLSLNGAAAMFYNRTYGPRAVIYIMLFALLHIGFSYVRNLLYYYAMTKFLYKKQKELGRWLISI